MSTTDSDDYKIVYLMRHGETNNNVERRHQGPDVPLNEQGRIQAEQLGQRVENLPLEVLLASTFIRAKETAEIVHKHVHHIPLSFHDEFIECYSPKELHNVLYTDPKNIHYMQARNEHDNDPEWKYADEESFAERDERARQAVSLLEKRPEQHIGVVTHGRFLQHLIAAMWRQELSPRDSQRHHYFMHVANTGLTIARYDRVVENPWRLLTWNDYAHLADYGTTKLH